MEYWKLLNGAGAHTIFVTPTASVAGNNVTNTANITNEDQYDQHYQIILLMLRFMYLADVSVNN